MIIIIHLAQILTQEISGISEQSLILAKLIEQWQIYLTKQDDISLVDYLWNLLTLVKYWITILWHNVCLVIKVGCVKTNVCGDHKFIQIISEQAVQSLQWECLHHLRHFDHRTPSVQCLYWCVCWVLCWIKVGLDDYCRREAPDYHTSVHPKGDHYCKEHCHSMEVPYLQTHSSI